MKRLSAYRFKIWIDLGIEIPADKLSGELSTAVEGCEIFILLASINSQGSTWVQFEIAEAKKIPELPEQRNTRFSKPRPNRFRDTVVLALDDWGTEIYADVKQVNEDLLREYAMADWTELKDAWAEAENELPPAVKYLAKTFGKGAKQLMSPNPSATRILTPTVTLFDMREPWESVMQQLAEYLSNNTQLLRSRSGAYKVIRTLLLAFWGLGMLSTGLVLLVILFGIVKG
jgi:hypothetical protein